MIALRAYIRREVAGAFTPENVILYDALDYLSDDCEPHRLRPHAERYLTEAIDAQRRAEARWPATTDCDRLDRAFFELEQRGIIARQHYSCCGTCGVADIIDEMEAATAQGRPARGYTFYHVQDTDSAIDGLGLYLNYGAAEGGEAPALAVGRVIVDVLTKHGLQADWNEDWKKRIHVRFDWKKRRFLHLHA